MNEQPSSLTLTMREYYTVRTHTHKQESLPCDKNARGVFAFSPYSLLYPCIFMRRARNQKEAGVWKHNGCRWCCVVHPCGWRLAVCALSCVWRSTGRDEIKWHGVDNSGLKFKCANVFKNRAKNAAWDTEFHRRPHHYRTKHPFVDFTLVVYWFLPRSFFCFYTRRLLFCLRWRGKLRGSWKLWLASFDLSSRFK